MRKVVSVAVVLVAVAVAAWWCFRQCRGVSNCEVKSAVESASAAIRARADERYSALDAKLDRIEAKLDKIIDMATPKLTDGMRAAE